MNSPTEAKRGELTNPCAKAGAARGGGGSDRMLQRVSVPVRAGMARYFQTRPPLSDGHGRVAVN